MTAWVRVGMPEKRGLRIPPVVSEERPATYFTASGSDVFPELPLLLVLVYLDHHRYQVGRTVLFRCAPLQTCIVGDKCGYRQRVSDEPPT